MLTDWKIRPRETCTVQGDMNHSLALEAMMLTPSQLQDSQPVLHSQMIKTIFWAIQGAKKLAHNFLRKYNMNQPLGLHYLYIDLHDVKGMLQLSEKRPGFIGKIK